MKSPVGYEQVPPAAQVLGARIKLPSLSAGRDHSFIFLCAGQNLIDAPPATLQLGPGGLLCGLNGRHRHHHIAHYIALLPCPALPCCPGSLSDISPISTASSSRSAREGGTEGGGGETHAQSPTTLPTAIFCTCIGSQTSWAAASSSVHISSSHMRRGTKRREAVWRID